MASVQPFTPEYKQCSRCREVKHCSEFYPRRDGRQPYRSQCKPCQNETNRRTRDPVKRREAERRRFLSDRQSARARGRRYRDRKRGAPPETYLPRGERTTAERNRIWRIANSERLREYGRRYYREHRDESISNNREWRRNNPDRARAIRTRSKHLRRAARGHYSQEQLDARWHYYGGRCWLCGAIADTTDHVIPLSRGGTNWPANLRPACRPCNSGKKDRDWRSRITT